MKKVIHFVSLMMFLMILFGCISNNSADEKFMDIDSDGIDQITISSQITEKKKDVVIESDKVEDFIKKLNSYSLKETTNEKKKGWEYLIKIEKSDGEITLISFMDNTVQVNEIIYEVKDYNMNDFSYLFDYFYPSFSPAISADDSN